MGGPGRWGDPDVGGTRTLEQRLEEDQDWADPDVGATRTLEQRLEEDQDWADHRWDWQEDKIER